MNVWRGFCKGTSKVVSTNFKLTNVHIFEMSCAANVLKKFFSLLLCKDRT